MKNTLAIIAKKFLDAVFPPLCISCQGRVSQVHSLCSTCWGNMTFISKPLCKICGIPFPTKNEGEICMHCLSERPVYAKARSVVRFDDNVAKLVHALKYYDRTELAPAMAQLMFQSCKELLHDVDIIAPIPLHPNRLRKRRFNQSLLLARYLAKLGKFELISDLLVRVKDIPSQSGLSRVKRFANVSNAFEFNHSYYGNVAGKQVLLVDDVITTGATLNECVHSFKQSKPKSVVGISFARSY